MWKNSHQYFKGIPTWANKVKSIFYQYYAGAFFQLFHFVHACEDMDVEKECQINLAGEQKIYILFLNHFEMFKSLFQIYFLHNFWTEWKHF